MPPPALACVRLSYHIITVFDTHTHKHTHTLCSTHTHTHIHTHTAFDTHTLFAPVSQAAVVPLALAGRDVCGSAIT